MLQDVSPRLSTNVEQGSPTLDSFYLDTIENSQDTNFWTTDVDVNNVTITFKVDTGAEVTVISEETLKVLGSPVTTTPTKKLCGPNGQPLSLIGSLTVTMSQKQHECQQDIFVVQHLKHNLLGLPTIRALHLLAAIDNVEADPASSIKQQFPSLFTGLGTLQGDYEIKLKPDAKPFSLGTARNIPLLLRDKVKQELSNMEAQGVISKVQQPTQWCAGMVIVSKKSGGVRVCVDLKPLNRCVLREYHPLPKVDKVLAQLTGATMFSKLDANSGFWQVPLSHNCRELTTFITPFGRFHYNKTAAIELMESPKSVTKLRRFLGMVNQLGKFSPHIAELSKPLRQLLSDKRAWVWMPAQDEAFTKLKKELTNPNILALYDPTAETTVSADASSHGLGAVLLQKVHNNWHPIAYMLHGP